MNLYCFVMVWMLKTCIGLFQIYYYWFSTCYFLPATDAKNSFCLPTATFLSSFFIFSPTPFWTELFFNSKSHLCKLKQIHRLDAILSLIKLNCAGWARGVEKQYSREIIKSDLLTGQKKPPGESYHQKFQFKLQKLWKL